MHLLANGDISIVTPNYRTLEETLALLSRPNHYGAPTVLLGCHPDSSNWTALLIFRV